MALGGIWIVGFVGLLTLLWWIFFPSKTRKWMSKIPGPKPLPVIGNGHQFKSNGHEFYKQLLQFARDYDKHRLYRLMFGLQPAVVLFKPDTVEILLNSTNHLTKSIEYRFIHPWLSTGLLTSTGQKWHTRRKLLTPTFHFRILDDFLAVFNEQTKIMIDLLGRQCAKGQFDLFPMVTNCTLDIICESAMGQQINAQSETSSEYVDAVYKMSELIMMRIKTPWYGPDFLYNLIGEGKEFQRCLRILHQFTEKVIKERSTELNEQLDNENKQVQTDFANAQKSDMLIGKRKRLAFLDMLLHISKTDESFGFYDIREEVDTFMFEGHDTTAAAVSWASYLIASHPDIQCKVHEELDEIFGEDRLRDITMEDIRAMKYLECVIKESLRIFPSVPFIARTLCEDCVINGFNIPKDATAFVLTAALHRDEHSFPDPERFDPDRFLPENSVGRHPFCYVPFSAGMRNCIGQRFAMNEEKVMLGSIFRNFTMTSLQTREDVRPNYDLILRPDTGIIVELSRRK